MSALLEELQTDDILDSLNDGVYATDRNRRIVYWNDAAERITGWSAEEVVGRWCGAGVLCHVDKDGHSLCGREFCPLHRAISTETRSSRPVVVYARTKTGNRIPTEVSVAPLRNATGEVVGGVEVFRDLVDSFRDLEAARRIQCTGLHSHVEAESPITVRSHYVPHDMVGGDFQCFEQIDQHLYAGMQADVMGHGVAAALYTMHLRSVWEEKRATLADPAEFVTKLSACLHPLLRGNSAFATGMAFMIDTSKRELRWTCAGHQPALLFHGEDPPRPLQDPGLPLGLLEDSRYESHIETFEPGDVLLLHSDGATEVTDTGGKMLDTDGFVHLLDELGYPLNRTPMEKIEKAVLAYSDRIRLNDDLALLEVRWNNEDGCG